MVNNQISKNTTLGEAVSKFPESAGILMKYGLHCIGCHVASWETIEQGAQAHGLSEPQIKEMIENINNTIDKSRKQ